MAEVFSVGVSVYPSRAGAMSSAPTIMLCSEVQNMDYVPELLSRAASRGECIVAARTFSAALPVDSRTRARASSGERLRASLVAAAIESRQKKTGIILFMVEDLESKNPAAESLFVNASGAAGIRFCCES